MTPRVGVAMVSHVCLPSPARATAFLNISKLETRKRKTAHFTPQGQQTAAIYW
jgi:hypothetical protein